MNKEQKIQKVVSGIMQLAIESLVFDTIADDLLLIDTMLYLNLDPEEARLNLEEQGFIKKINKPTYKRIKR